MWIAHKSHIIDNVDDEHASCHGAHRNAKSRPIVRFVDGNTSMRASDLAFDFVDGK
jgi:hypothetical protein